MSKTLEELKRENEKLKNLIENKRDLIAIGKERNRLLRENKSLMNRYKHPARYNFAKGFGSSSLNAGKKIGIGLIKFAKNYQESERREESLRRKITKGGIRKMGKKGRKKKRR